MTREQAEHLKKLQAAFLEDFAVTGNISESCRNVGIKRRNQIYEWQEHDEPFALAFREAEIKSIEVLETEARRRATRGTRKPVYQNGKLVGHVRERSDTLLIFLLKARAPAKYRERWQIQHSDAEGNRLPIAAVAEYVEQALKG